MIRSLHTFASRMTAFSNSGRGVYRNQIFNLLILLLMVQPISNFEFRCPEPSQWNLRAAAICNGSVSAYVCLYDDNNQQYRERCEPKQDFQPAGFKDVILGGLQRKQCNTERYQPFKFWTNGSNDCIYQKSLCEEEGQITYNHGTPTTDRCCRCDYTKGYTYVFTPKNPCFCVSTEEDCSCFKTTCDIGFVLGPDYECVNVTSWSGNFKCPDIKHTRSDFLPTDSRVTLLTDSNISDEISTSSTVTGMLSLVMICLSITVMVVTYCMQKKNEKLKGDPSNESTQNRYARLALVLNRLSKLAREVIRCRIQPNTLYNIIEMARKTNSKKIDLIITQEQFVSLNRNTYEKLEFTDIYKLLRVFGLLPEPGKGWGGQPTASDTEIADDIERLNRISNSVVNKCINDISQAKFDQYFSDVITVAKRVDKYLGKKYGKGFETELKEIKTCTLDLTQMKNFSQALLDTENIQYRLTEGKYHIYFGKKVENLIGKVSAEPAKDETIKITIVIENLEDEEEKTRQLNNLKQQINDGQVPIEFVKAETGSVILFANILDTIICSGNFYSELGLFLEHVLGFVCSEQSVNQHINAIIAHEDDCSELDFAIEDEESLNTCFDPKSIRVEVNVNTELFQSVELLESEVANFMKRASRTNGTGGGSYASAILTTHVSVDTSRQEPEIQFQVTSDVTRTDSTKDIIKCSSQLKENYKRALTMPHEDDEECEIKNQQDSAIDQWEEEDKTFVMTETVLSILTHLEKINDVIITGPTGIGKSVILRHIALEYKNKHGYSVVICDNPSELENLYSKDTKQIFVIDDICGKYTVNKNELHIWEDNKTLVTRLLVKGNVKIIASCNDQIFRNQMFQRSLSLTQNAFDLTSAKYSLSIEQKRQIARQYLPNKIINKIALPSKKYPFLPLLCSLASNMSEERAVDLFNDPVTHYTKELDSFLVPGKHDKCKSFALFLLVVHNGRLSQTHFSGDDNENEFLNSIRNSCGAFEIRHNTHIRHNIMTELNNLVGKYLRKDGTSFTALHEIIFDILCKYFGNKFQKEIIINANISIISERTQLESLDEVNYQFTIMISKENEENYFKRILSKPNIEDITCNSQMKFPGYRVKLLDHIKRHIVEDQELKTLLTLASNDKKSTLHIACTEGYVELVEYILELKEDLNADECPYVFEACLKGHDKIAQLLIEKGADINKASSSGMTPLMVACVNKNGELINYLIDKGSDLYKPSNNGLSPLTAVCKDGDQTIFEQLLDKNIDINKTSGSGWTPLMTASENGHELIVNSLIKKNADVNAVDYNGQTALMKACIGGYKTIVAKLLRKNANANIADNNGTNPLSKSCQSGYREISELLIANGSIVNHCDNYGNTPLIKVCKYGHKSIAQLLIDNGAEKDKESNIGGFTPLIVACDAGQEETVNLLLKNKCNVNKSDHSKCTPLIMASRNGNLQIVRQLITESADVRQADENGWTSLMKACEAGFVEIASVLIKERAVVDRPDIEGWTSLNKACKNQHFQIVNLLINNTADINKACTSGWTPFMTACETDNMTLIDILIKNGADINKSNNSGWTALLAACKRGNYSLVEYLISKGCKVNQSHASKMTPLMIACENGHDLIVNLLIENKADIHAVDNHKRTVLMIAYHHGYIDIVHVLAEKMAQVDQKDYDEWTIIMKASRIGDNAMINFLLDRGANVNNCDVDGETCLIKASKVGYKKTVELLLDKEAECDKKDNKGWSPLMWATEYGHKAVVSKLLKNGADVNHSDGKRWTGLMSACNRGYKDIVELLLSHGANPYILNNNDEKAIDIARKGDRTEIVSILEHLIN